mgnify:FL=1
MAGVKYIKKTKDAEGDAPVKKAGTRAAANTKAKVTTKPETETTTTTGRGRGRPKAAAKTEEGALHHVRQISVDRQAKTMSEAPKRKPGRPKKTTTEDAPAKTTLATRKRKATATPEPAVAKKAKVAPKGPVINEAPTQRLDVFVCGEGSSGELGLGTSKKAIDVKRPRLNKSLLEACTLWP